MKKTDNKSEKALFAAGCFWEAEEAFRTVNGVIKTTVGYSGGNDEKYPNPTYEQVCSDKTGFAESCLVEFNSKIVSFVDLLKIFWEIHDPTQLNRQGPDFGSQYRSAIFYLTAEQKTEAENSKKEEQKKYRKKIVTEITEAGKFHKAEEYHQHYLLNRGMKTCRV